MANLVVGQGCKACDCWATVAGRLPLGACLSKGYAGSPALLRPVGDVHDAGFGIVCWNRRRDGTRRLRLSLFSPVAVRRILTVPRLGLHHPSVAHRPVPGGIRLDPVGMPTGSIHQPGNWGLLLRHN